jgi:hypothetical protein
MKPKNNPKPKFIMKEIIITFLLGFLFISSGLTGQEFHGSVIDAESKWPLAFVNIGVVDFPHGTITNESGEYTLNCAKLPEDCKIQISMIGYESRLYHLADLKAGIQTIELVKKVYELEEVTIKWKEKLRKAGTSRISKFAGVCGWGGTDFGKGHEIGLMLNLGDNPVMMENINLKIRKHSFDTIFFRLHIRSVHDGMPSDELLTQNIYFPVTKYSGWQRINLSDYNIVVAGDVILTIEWVKVSNVIEKNLIKMNGSDIASPNVLFYKSNKSGTFYIRKGSAARWRRQETSSPAFYVTVRE